MYRSCYSSNRGATSTIDVVDLLVSFVEVAFWVFRLLFVFSHFGRLEDLIYKTLQSVAVPGLVLPLGVEDADPVQETFKPSESGPILLVPVWPLHICHGVILVPLLVITLQGAGLI
jgi:hypothetical protein